MSGIAVTLPSSLGNRLPWCGLRFCTMTNAIPVLGGKWRNNSIAASNPPTEPPMPTIGQLPSLRLLPPRWLAFCDFVRRRVRFLCAAAFFEFFAGAFGLLTNQHNASLLQKIQDANCFAPLVAASRRHLAREKIPWCLSKRIQFWVFSVHAGDTEAWASHQVLLSREGRSPTNGGYAFLDEVPLNLPKP
jgi:hypothetical protein